MRKYLLLILLVVAMPVRAESEEAPNKFKNPKFYNAGGICRRLKAVA